MPIERPEHLIVATREADAGHELETDGIRRLSIDAEALAARLPLPPGTDDVLTALARHDVTATFFMEGWRLEGEAECARRVVDAGHLIGNHSYSHSNFDELTPDVALDEVRQADEIITAATGVASALFRPPWGRLDPEVTAAVLDAGYDIVLWNCSIRDWEGPDAGAVASRILDTARDGAIVALHDRVTWNPDVLDRVIPHLRGQGYDFRPVSEAPENETVMRAHRPPRRETVGPDDTPDLPPETR